MKRYLGILSALLLVGSQQVTAQESDDMYFFKSDRVRPEKTALALPSTASRPDFTANEGGQAVVQSKFQNPDFNSNQGNTSTVAYVQEDQVLKNNNQSWNNINNPYYVANNTANGNNWGNNRWGRPSFNVGMGMGGWGSMTSIGMSWGMGSMMNNWGGGYGMMNNGFGYDPWGNSFGYSPWGCSNYFSPWGMGKVKLLFAYRHYC